MRSVGEAHHVAAELGLARQLTVVVHDIELGADLLHEVKVVRDAQLLLDTLRVREAILRMVGLMRDDDLQLAARELQWRVPAALLLALEDAQCAAVVVEALHGTQERLATQRGPDANLLLDPLVDQLIEEELQQLLGRRACLQQVFVVLGQQHFDKVGPFVIVDIDQVLDQRDTLDRATVIHSCVHLLIIEAWTGTHFVGDLLSLSQSLSLSLVPVRSSTCSQFVG